MVILIFYSIDFFYKKYVILESGQFELIKGTSISELVTNLFLFRNLEISNISKIINQLLIDRPVSYLLLLFIILNVFRLTKNSKDEELNLIFTLVIINFVLIFVDERVFCHSNLCLTVVNTDFFPDFCTCF